MLYGTPDMKPFIFRYAQPLALDVSSDTDVTESKNLAMPLRSTRFTRVRQETTDDD